MFFRKGLNMSDISSIHSSPQAMPVATPRVAVQEVDRQGVALAVKPMEKPQITAPKPNQINFDPKKQQENLAQAINLLNEQMVSTKQGLGFSVDKSVPVPIVTVRNNSNGEVIRQLPSEEAVKMAHHLDSLKGFLQSARV
jgi:flagellar protein FlaG